MTMTPNLLILVRLPQARENVWVVTALVGTVMADSRGVTECCRQARWMAGFSNRPMGAFRSESRGHMPKEGRPWSCGARGSDVPSPLTRAILLCTSGGGALAGGDAAPSVSTGLRRMAVKKLEKEKKSLGAQIFRHGVQWRNPGPRERCKSQRYNSGLGATCDIAAPPAAQQVPGTSGGL